MARNNSNKKSTNNRAQLPALSRFEAQLLLAEARKGLGPMPRQNNNRRSSQRPKRRNNEGVAVAYSVSNKTLPPKITSGPKSSRIVHRELISNLAATGAGFAQLKRLRVNPASVRTFPWLSSIAPSFETFRFHRICFSFMARCPTNTPGSIICSPDYDAQDGVPANEVLMTQLKDSVESSPWKDFRCILSPSELNRTYKGHFTMDDTRFNTTSQDEKTIDPAQVFIASDTDGAINLSKLWVEYDCELFTPQSPNLPLNLGGAGLGGQSVTPGAGANAFNGVATTVAQDAIIPLLTYVANGSTTLGIFNRDWSGFIDTNLNGTAITSTGNVTLDGVASGVTAVGQIINAAATAANKQTFITALAGQVLGLTGATAATLTGSNFNLGASTYA